MQSSPQAPQTAQAPSRRRAYEKPALRTISLVADQVLANTCKTTTGTTGVLVTGCRRLPATQCLAMGS